MHILRTVFPTKDQVHVRINFILEKTTGFFNGHLCRGRRIQEKMDILGILSNFVDSFIFSCIHVDVTSVFCPSQSGDLERRPLF